MLARSFFIKSSSELLVTRTGIKAWSSSILGWIRLLILELLALEWRKFHTFELEYLWSQLASLDQILCVASLGWVKGCIRFWGRLDQNSGFHGITGVGERLHYVLKQIGSKLWLPWQQKAPIDLQWGKWCLHLFSVVFDPFLFILAGNEDMHKILDKFEFRPDWTTDYRVSCLWGLKNFP